MITVSETIKNIFKKDYAIRIKFGGTIEYNLNNMVDKITATGTAHSQSLSNAFKNLFPIDTIYAPNRPISPGIKYYIYTSETSPGVQTDTPPNSFQNPRSIEMSTKPRLYYPGPDTTYKYWVGPKNTNISVSLEYFDNAETPAVKLIPCNKIVARFETNHDTPTSWTITATKSDNTTVVVTGSTLNSSGEAIAYYNGTTWSTTQPTSYTTTEYFKKISLSAVNSNTGKFLGVLELSPRWVIDINDYIQDFSIDKQTSITDDSILPVGTIASSLLNLNITRFVQGDNVITEYNRDSAIDNTKIYLTKNAIVSPYIIINDGTNDVNIPQGKYYMAEYSLSEFGSASIKCLDSSKILQDTLVPLILIQDTPVTAIIRRVLDSIGYSNYNINSKTTDTSVPSLKYFWTKDGQTVWECLQELCRDTQINMFVDNNDILQIYTRDYIYDSSKEASWIFTNEDITINNSLAYIPNIVNLNKEEKVAGNSVKILWSAPGTSGYISGNSAPVWTSFDQGLGAGTLNTSLTATDTTYINLNIQSVDQLFLDNLSLPNFNGYLLLNGEIIEYDGIEYQYIPIGSNTVVPVLIKNESDFWKYASLAGTDVNNVTTFIPTHRYKIKTRGALGTTAKAHAAAQDAGTNLPNGVSITTYGPINLTAPGDTADQIGNVNQIFNTAKETWLKNKKSLNKAFYAVSNFDQSSTNYTSSVVTFSSISTTSKPGCYSMGGRLFFDNQFDTGLKDQVTTSQSGGFTIFAGETGKKGYHVVISTTALAKTGKDVKVLKTDSSGKTTVLKTSQTNAVSTYAGIYAAQTYNVDILVKSVYVSSNLVKNVITIWINGFRIDVEDLSSPLAPSSRLGLICGQGIVYYDYVYGLNVPEASNLTDIDYTNLYAKSSYTYKGVYSDDMISMLFGDIIYNPGETKDSRNGSLIEFGSVARQIAKQKVKYDTENPAIPLYVSTGGNQAVTLMASKIQPFTSEMYVLNNTSGFVNLHDGEYHTFTVIGNPVMSGGITEYSTDDPNSRAKKYPVQFESNWIQSESDAKALADWIVKTQLNKGQKIEMQVFGNPIIEPGDIVSINYPLQDLLYTDKKYIVTSVSSEFQEGVNTRVTCRAI